MSVRSVTKVPERVRFFSGQFLTAEDFEVEQKYHIEMRRLHNRMLHGVGIVEGLGVSIDESQDGTAVVSPGLALDGLGREIIVDRPVRVELGIGTSDFGFVTIEYVELKTDPVPTSNGGSEFSRVKESFLIGTAQQAPGGNGTGLALARLIRQGGGWVIDENYCPISVFKQTEQRPAS
jgi:hypothetical protein